MNDTNHFQVKTSSENGETNQVELNFRNIPEADAVQLLHGPLWDAIKETAYAHKINQVQISDSLTKVFKFKNNSVSQIIPQFKSNDSGKSVYSFEGIPGVACQSKAASVSSTVERNIGILQIDYSKTVQNVAFHQPTYKNEMSYIQMAFGTPK
ncbi:hypothetical protein I4U23_024653 [Adineta vaga]|nr:hypothetical protein I4U23_024653 [Adineta vaga]